MTKRGAEPVADAEQVVEDEHLAVGGRTGADADHGISISPISSSVTALGIASKTSAKQPASCRASASAAICAAAARGAPLRLPAAERGGGLGGEPDVAHHGDARRRRSRARALADASPPPSSLTASQPASLTMRMRGGDRLLVGDLVGAERQVADQQRGAQAAADGAGEHEHVLEHHGRGGAVAEHGGGGRVAHEHQVDPAGLGGAGARIVIGGDHHDRFAEPLLLRQQRQRHRQLAGVGGACAVAAWLDMVLPL